MSTVVRAQDGRIKLYTKGADTVIYERLAAKQPFSEPTLVHLEVGVSAFEVEQLNDIQSYRTMRPKGCEPFA